MPLHQVTAIIDDLSFKRFCRLDILGGEPLLHDNWRDIVRYAKKKKYIERIQLYTNASLVTESIAKDVHACGVDVAIVSLFSPDRATCNNNAQADTKWDATLRGIRHLRAAGVETYIMVVLNKENVNSLEGFETLARENDVKLIYFSYIPQSAHDSSCVTDKKVRENVQKWIWERSRRFQQKVVRHLKKTHSVCKAFFESIAITVQGDLLPCPFSDVVLGNVFKESFPEILKRGFFSAAMRHFYQTPEECQTCSLLSLCGGGCKILQRLKNAEDYSQSISSCPGPYREYVDTKELGLYLPFIE